MAVRCPVCDAIGTLGLLQQMKRGQSVAARYFCRSCCTEIAFVDGQVSSIFTIDEEGEVRRQPTFWRMTPRLSAAS